MKNCIFLTLLLLLSIPASTQTVIDNPKIGFSTALNVNIRKVELLDTATILYFQTYGGGDASFLIPDKTFIQAFGENERLYITRAEGITINSWTGFGEKGEVSYKLFFPKLGNTVSKFDYGEANDGGSWFIYDIQLKTSAEKSVVPQEIYGNWFDQSTGVLYVSFYDSIAVYNSKLWSYREVKIKNGEGIIKLSSKNKETELTLRKGEKGLISIMDKNGNTTSCGKESLKNAGNSMVETPYELPVFKQDSAIYSGFFKGYSPRFMDKTFTVAVDDIITGKQNTFLIKISDDGYFSIKLPLYYPHYVWVRSKCFNGPVFLEPGKEIFQLTDPQSGSGLPLFMGESAEINSDLQKLQRINSFNYYDLKSKILDMKPSDYKKYFQDWQKQELKSLESFKENSSVSARAYQIKKMEIDYTYLSNLMNYEMYFESTYREKNNISWTQTLPVKMDSFPVDYFNFISNQYVNNPLSVLASSYNSFVNYVKYAPVLRSSGFYYSGAMIFEELQKEGYVFSESEKVLYAKMKVEDSIKNIPENKILFEKYGNFTNTFMKKYADTLQGLFKESNGNLSLETMGKYLTSKGVKLTEEETRNISENQELYKKTSLEKSYYDSVARFINKHNDIINKLYALQQKVARSENLEKKLGIKKGFISDIMDAQDICRGVVEELSPLSDSELKSAQNGISTPFIANYISFCNEQTKLKLEANKKKQDFIVNEVPNTGPEQLFDSIMKKYKGKVVYVDFWATWCGPCRMSIEQIAPLKEELAGENVVFIYITGPSSPEKTWSNMIPNIKGEHYRVSNDEWNYLYAKFNISGIPHYVLVGKDGRVINPACSHFMNETLKAELVKWMNE